MQTNITPSKVFKDASELLYSSGISGLIVLATVSGCSFAPIGENRFDCNRKDNPNAYCRSIKALERSTQGELPETRYEKQFNMQDYDRAYELNDTVQKKSLPLQLGIETLSVKKSYSALPPYPMGGEEILKGAPVRVAPVIQRVYIKSYVDADDMLIQDQIIYKEIARSKWTGFEGGSSPKSGVNLSDGLLQPHRQVFNDIRNTPLTPPHEGAIQNSKDSKNSKNSIGQSDMAQPGVSNNVSLNSGFKSFSSLKTEANAFVSDDVNNTVNIDTYEYGRDSLPRSSND